MIKYIFNFIYKFLKRDTCEQCMLFFLLFLFPFSCLKASATDSVLINLKQECISNIDSTNFLELNKRYRELAISLNDNFSKFNSYEMAINYYYRNNDEEQLKEETEILSLLCKSEFNQPGYQYGCFRVLIDYYINKNELITAVHMADSLVNNAIDDGDKISIAVSEKIYSDIYFRIGLYEKAINSYKASIKDWPEDKNDLMSYYEANLRLAISLMKEGEAESALEASSVAQGLIEALDSSAHYPLISKTFSQYILLIHLNCNALLGEMDKIQGYYNRLLLFKNNSKESDKLIYEAEITYFNFKRNYKRALAASFELLELQDSTTHYYNELNLYRAIGDSYYNLNDKTNAAKYYKSFFKGVDSLSATSSIKFLKKIQIDGGLYVMRLNDDKQSQVIARRTIQLFFIIFIVVFIVFIAFYIFYRNYRSLKIAKEKTREALDLAQLSSKSRSDFIRHISHEIRTPLNSIIGFSDLLRDMYEEDENKKEFFHLIIKNSEKLTLAVDDILSISTVESMVVEEKESNYLPVLEIRNIEKDVRKSIELDVETGENITLPVIPIYCHFDENHSFLHKTKTINYATRNLLRAMISLRSKGVLSIDLYLEVGQFIIKITDNGDFLSEEQKKKFFELFYKVDDFKLGLGTSIYIASTIAETMGGSLSLDNKYRLGTSLNFSIPILGNRFDERTYQFKEED